jgi:hypothetical protein|tara:strand:- start:54 stop:296 length:243 start_codon:yes stop_codon:yes gene_type:complete
MTEDKKITPTDALKKAEQLIEELKKHKDSQSKKFLEYEGKKYDKEGLIQKLTEEFIEEGSSKKEARKKAEKVLFLKKWIY